MLTIFDFSKKISQLNKEKKFKDSLEYFRKIKESLLLRKLVKIGI